MTELKYPKEKPDAKQFIEVFKLLVQVIIIEPVSDLAKRIFKKI